MLDEAIEAILNGVSKMFAEFGKKIDKRFNRVEGKLGKVEGRLGKIETEVRYVKDEVRGLKADISDTPSRREFEKLKETVKHHPTV